MRATDTSRGRFLSPIVAAIVSSVLTSFFVSSDASSEIQAEVQSKDGEVRASRFILEDENGNPRGEWTVSENGTPGFALLDKEGFPVVGISVDDGVPNFALLGPANSDDKRTSVSFEAREDSPYGSLASQTGGASISLEVVDNTTPRIELLKTGTLGDMKMGTLAGLQVSERGPNFIALPTHTLEASEKGNLPPGTVIIGAMDEKPVKFGMRLIGQKDQNTDWPAEPEDE